MVSPLSALFFPTVLARRSLDMQEYGSEGGSALSLHAGQQGCHGDTSVVKPGLLLPTNAKLCEFDIARISSPRLLHSACTDNGHLQSRCSGGV